ncbi:hypothetical protein HZY97_01490 [Sphingomonas sp. R-74633]|uniref:hypothetical protein n=1 Tax=Sphingomonas sp. R-74633 TaxID=2751188 RepID=UPI0015D319EA|nr:hypothetical protein [Sphingomonas sp. R-74633]NYT39418.1 hypothetical protein [Sphingomonas sp. R-74633]
MTDDAAPAPNHPGCLALLVSVALASLLLTLTIFPPAFTTPMIYVPIFGATTFIATLIGLPLYLVARYFRQENIWTALAAGAVTGAALPVIGAFSEGTPQAWLVAAGYGITGTIGGLAYFLTATAPRAPRRNAALLVALTCISAATAQPAVAWLSPPAPSSAAR